MDTKVIGSTAGTSAGGGDSVPNTPLSTTSGVELKFQTPEKLKTETGKKLGNFFK